MDLEGLVGLLPVLVVLQEYWVNDWVDLVDRGCPDLSANLQVVLLLCIPKEC